MQKADPFLIGFVLGALVGAAAALLLTPDSGEELRKQIGEKGEELKFEGSTAGRCAPDHGRIVMSENVKKAQQVVQEAQVKLSKPVAAPDVPAEIPA